MPVLPVDPHLFSTFLGIMAVMAITPGPANLFAVASGVQRGRASALVSVAGMNSASLVWFGAAALGLGALVAAFPAVFRLIAARTDPHMAYVDSNVIYLIHGTIGGDARIRWNQLDIDFAAACKERGLWPFTHFNRTHIVPPCTTTVEEMTEGLDIIDAALDVADEYCAQAGG